MAGFRASGEQHLPSTAKGVFGVATVSDHRPEEELLRRRPHRILGRLQSFRKFAVSKSAPRGSANEFLDVNAADGAATPHLQLTNESEEDFTSNILQSFATIIHRNSSALDVTQHDLHSPWSTEERRGPYSVQITSTESLPQTIGASVLTASDTTEIQSVFSFTPADRDARARDVPIRIASTSLALEEFYDAIPEDEEETEEQRLSDFLPRIRRGIVGDEFLTMEDQERCTPQEYFPDATRGSGRAATSVPVDDAFDDELRELLSDAQMLFEYCETPAQPVVSPTVKTISMECPVCQQAVQENDIVRVRDGRVVHLECCRDSPPPSYFSTDPVLDTSITRTEPLTMPWPSASRQYITANHSPTPHGMVRSPFSAPWSAFDPVLPVPVDGRRTATPLVSPYTTSNFLVNQHEDQVVCPLSWYQHNTPIPAYSSPPSQASLPVELWDSIIDALLDEPHALLACAFVCKAWFARCRIYLSLGVLQLGNHHDVIRLSRYVRAHRAFARREFVKIQGGAGRSLAHLPTFIAQLAGRMPHLESLLIEDGLWRTGMTNVGFFTRAASFTSISRLMLNDVTFPSTSIFAQLVCALRQLAELYCIDVKTMQKRSGQRLYLPLTCHSKLSHLTLVGQNVHDIIEFFTASGLAPRLTDLTLHIGFIDSRHCIPLDAVAYRGLLPTCRSLRVLHLRFRDAATACAVTSDNVLAHYLSLGGKHNIEVLHLSIEPHLHGDYHLTSISALLCSISPNTTVRELVITLDIQYEANETTHNLLLTRLSDETDMTQLDKVLATRRYTDLENVEVILRVGHIESRLVKPREALWMERVEAQLRELRLKGILRVRVKT